MVKDVNLMLANHASGVHVADILEYIHAGVRQVGGRASYSQFRWEPHQINIILENFGDDRFTSDVMEARQQSPEVKLYVIVTELMVNGRMNSSEHQGESKGDGHYENSAYWEKRTANFKSLLPHIDGLICVSEALYEGYTGLHDHLAYLPLAYYEPPRPQTFLPQGDRDIDILFSGTLTPYRDTLLQAWRRAGLRVEHLSAHTPDYVRADYCSRSKVYLGLKLSEHARLLSKSRSQYALINRIPHLFEPVLLPTDLDEFLNFIPHGVDTSAYVHDWLQAGRIPPCRTESYRTSPKLSLEDTFQTLLRFCNSMP